MKFLQFLDSSKFAFVCSFIWLTVGVLSAVAPTEVWWHGFWRGALAVFILIVAQLIKYGGPRFLLQAWAVVLLLEQIANYVQWLRT